MIENNELIPFFEFSLKLNLKVIKKYPDIEKLF